MKKIISMFLIMTLCIFTMSANVAEASNKISKSKATMEVDSTLKLKITGAIGSIAWSSSKKSVAIVSDTGLVTACADGQAIITARDGSGKYTCKIIVIDSNQPIMTAEEFEEHLNKTYQVIDTPMGSVQMIHTVTNTSEYSSANFSISTEWDGVTPYDIEYSEEYTTKEKTATKNTLASIQKSIYTDASKYIPNQKVEGGFISTWYDIPSIHVGYNSIRFLSWNNFENGSIDEFKWTEAYDDYDFTK